MTKSNRWFVVAVSVLCTLLYHTLVPQTVEAHSYSGAPTFTTWSANQKLTSTDLNASMAHLHNTFSGNIDDSMISTAASIQHSKMQYPAVLPKAAVYVAAACAADPCTVGFQSRVSAVNWLGTGSYTVTLAYTAVNTTYGILLTANSGAGTLFCRGIAGTTTVFSVHCYDNAGTATNTGFMATVFDDDN